MSVYDGHGVGRLGYTRAASLSSSSFVYISSYHIVNSVCWSHALVNGIIVTHQLQLKVSMTSVQEEEQEEETLFVNGMHNNIV